MNTDGLDRFVEAQSPHYTEALAELRAGRKRTHWMWFVLPQLRGLGQSAMAYTYGIDGRDEAVAYFAHPVLGPRLVACVKATLGHRDRSARDIFGDVDALKFRSCLTLFATVAPGEACFREALHAFYGGRPDEATLQRLGASAADDGASPSHGNDKERHTPGSGKRS